MKNSKINLVILCYCLFFTINAFGNNNNNIKEFLKSKNINFIAPDESIYILSKEKLQVKVMEQLKMIVENEGYKMGIKDNGNIVIYSHPQKGPGSPIKGICIPCPQTPTPNR